MITLYHLVIFGGLTRDPDFMHYLGISMIASVGLILLMGSLVIMALNIHALKRKLRLRKMKSTRDALIKKRNKSVGEIRELASQNAETFDKGQRKQEKLEMLEYEVKIICYEANQHIMSIDAVIPDVDKVELGQGLERIT